MAYRLFKCAVPSCKYLFQDGHAAYFTDGRYATQDEKEIEELEAEIKAKHPHIYIDANEKEADAAILDPMSALKKRIIEDYLKEQTDAAKVNDLGTSGTDAGAGAGMTNSASAAAISAESLTGKIVAGPKTK